VLTLLMYLQRGYAVLVYMCDMTPLYIWHDSFVCVDMTHLLTYARVQCSLKNSVCSGACVGGSKRK